MTKDQDPSRLYPGRSLKYTGRLEYERNERTLPAEFVREEVLALRKQTLDFKDADILGMKSAKWNHTVHMDQNKFTKRWWVSRPGKTPQCDAVFDL